MIKIEALESRLARGDVLAILSTGFENGFIDQVFCWNPFTLIPNAREEGRIQHNKFLLFRRAVPYNSDK